MKATKSYIFSGDNHRSYGMAAGLFPAFTVIPIVTILYTHFDFRSIFMSFVLILLGMVLPIFLFIYKRYEIQFYEDDIQIDFTSAPNKNWSATYQQLVKVQFLEYQKGPPMAFFTFMNQSGKLKVIKVVIENKKSCIDLVNHCITMNSEIKIEARPLNGDMFLALKQSLYKRYFFDKTI